MRFELGGTMSASGSPGPGNPSNPPLLTLTFDANDTLDPLTYLELGYTSFDVIAIGAGGGPGGGIDQGFSGSGDGHNARIYGGVGGGGGLHRVKGSLLPLQDGGPIPIVVGVGGAPGTYQDGSTADPTLTTDGGDGGYSSFGTACQASGGKGGKRVDALQHENSPFPNLATNGGDGGIGGTVTAGGGGVGGIPAITASGPTIFAVDGQDGAWDPATGIGQGGGGGAGGYSLYLSLIKLFGRIEASAGGTGNFNAVDQGYYASGNAVNADSHPDSDGDPPSMAVPGMAGGGMIVALTHLGGIGREYGNSESPVNIPNPIQSQLAGDNGVVCVQLSSK